MKGRKNEIKKEIKEALKEIGVDTDKLYENRTKGGKNG